MPTITLEVQDRATVIPLLEAALQRQVAQLELGVVKTRKRLTAFEQTYGCRLDEADTAGISIDPMNRVEWEGETEMLQRLEREKTVLIAVRICA